MRARALPALLVSGVITITFIGGALAQSEPEPAPITPTGRTEPFACGDAPIASASFLPSGTGGFDRPREAVLALLRALRLRVEERTAETRSLNEDGTISDRPTLRRSAVFREREGEGPIAEIIVERIGRFWLATHVTTCGVLADMTGVPTADPGSAPGDG